MGLQNLVAKRVKFEHPPAIVNLTSQSIHLSLSLSLSLSLWLAIQRGKEKKRKVQSDCLID